MAERIKSVCVYCGSRFGEREEYTALARTLGGELARQDYDVVYGGGRVGLMGTVADAALAEGGRVIGIIPEHIRQQEVDHTGLSELHVVDSMHTRKKMMFDRSDAFIVLPGGIGTLDETIEIMTWRQLRLHDKPLLLLDHGGYWRPFLDLMAHLQREGFAYGGAADYLSVVDDIETAMAQLGRLEAHPAPAGTSDLM